MVTSKRDLSFVKLPIAEAAQSRNRRVGRFSLDAEGTLEGTVEETLTGHMAETIKRRYWRKNDDECRASLEKRVTGRLSTAEVTEITWEHLNDLEYPTVLRYKVRVPGYAEMLGERVMLDPSYFEHGNAPLFAPEKRRHDIMLDYPFSEQDEVEISLPAGYQLDQPSAPRPVADSAGFLRAEYDLRFINATRTLKYMRTFAVGSPALMVLKKEFYPAIKGLFTAVHESDNHALLIKPDDAGTAAAP